MKGWISIHRKILQNGMWLSEPFSRGQAWIDLLLLASHKPTYFYKRGVKIDLKRGQLGVSEVGLSQRWKWSRTKTRKFIKDLEKEQQIIQQKNNVTQVLTIINYDEYQQKEQQSGQQDGQQSGQQKDTFNNVNNVNKDNKSRGFIAPSAFEIDDYIKTRSIKIDGGEFLDYYQSIGWMRGKNKMKDWKAAVRTWERNIKEKAGVKKIKEKDYNNF